MAGNTRIEWTDSTWNPVRARIKADAAAIALEKGYVSLQALLLRVPPGKTGAHCEIISPGCEHCWAQTHNSRCLPSNGTGLPYDRRSRDLVDIYVDQAMLAAPLHWKKPRKIFVCSTTDLFGEFIPDDAIEEVLEIIRACPRHTFQALTKRPGRALAFASTLAQLPNLWFGVSAENQDTACERIPVLLRIPAPIHFVSYEPALGPIDFQSFLPSRTHLDWIIAGGESGPGARPFNIEWVRETLRQSAILGIACFIKQLGTWPFGPGALILKDRKGGDWSEWPADLRVRQFPDSMAQISK